MFESISDKTIALGSVFVAVVGAAISIVAIVVARRSNKLAESAAEHSLQLAGAEKRALLIQELDSYIWKNEELTYYLDEWERHLNSNKKKLALLEAFHTYGGKDKDPIEFIQSEREGHRESMSKLKKIRDILEANLEADPVFLEQMRPSISSSSSFLESSLERYKLIQKMQNEMAGRGSASGLDV